MKEILLHAGAKNLPAVFLLSDTQKINEAFLEDVNGILNSGDVPNLFDADELEKIIGERGFFYVTSNSLFIATFFPLNLILPLYPSSFDLLSHLLLTAVYFPFILSFIPPPLSFFPLALSLQLLFALSQRQLASQKVEMLSSVTMCI